ncbi:FkbM family methyltransferase [soil metagenome]
MSLWRTLRSHVRPLVYRFRNRLLYRMATFYVNVVDNDHDSDFYTNGEARFAHEMLPTSKVAFDVGAAFGNWSKIALEANPAIQLHCFEPTSRRFAALSKAVDGRATLNQLALGDTPGEQQIFYGASGGSNSIYPQRYNQEIYAASDVETIKISTIDDYCTTHGIESVDFIKMDIEGYEPAALRGAERMLRAGRIKVIQFEYSYVFLDAGASLMGLMKYMAEVNPAYRFHKLMPEAAKPVTVYDHTLDNFKTQNWAIIKTGA